MVVVVVCVGSGLKLELYEKDISAGFTEGGAKRRFMLRGGMSSVQSIRSIRSSSVRCVPCFLCLGK